MSDHLPSDLVSQLRALPQKLRTTPVHLGVHIKLLQDAADAIERLEADLQEARRCKHPTKRGTGSVTSDGKIITSALWCDTCGEKLS